MIGTIGKKERAKITYGQKPLMVLSDYLDLLSTIYNNNYFTNHGPLAKKFESDLESYLNVRNAVTIGNDSLALVMALAGLNISGKVLIPAFGAQLTLEAVQWAGLQVGLYDVDINTHHASNEVLNKDLSDEVEVVLLCEMWGSRYDSNLVASLIDKGLKVIIYSHGSFGSRLNNELVSQALDVVTVFSFADGNILSTEQGGGIMTNNDSLAEIYRNIRSSYGMRMPMKVNATANGRFSEFQAGLGVRNLRLMDDYITHNKLLFRRYHEALNKQEGIIIHSPVMSDDFNAQYFTLLIDEKRFSENRDQLYLRLKDNDIETSKACSTGLYDLIESQMKRNSNEYPVSKFLSQRAIQLPISSEMFPEDVSRITNLILRGN